MVKLSGAMAKVIVDEHGQQEFLRRLSDPLWFQAFGCVLGFDWHSSGVTTVVTGVLKQSLKPDVHGISIAGGKGKKSASVKTDIPAFAEDMGLSAARTDSLLRASRMAAKVDGAAVQDGYSLYHHVILFDGRGDWAIVQQGMNAENRMARRYHWLSEGLQSFVCEPHSGIISQARAQRALDMTAAMSQENQKTCVDLARGSTANLKSSVYRLAASGAMTASSSPTMTMTTVAKNGGSTLDQWLGGENDDNNSSGNSNNDKGAAAAVAAVQQAAVGVTVTGYEMPRRLDWELFARIYDIQPRNYEELLAIKGVGAATVRALSLVAQLIYGTSASWSDPVKYSFAHGGKDGVPYPVARRVYDESIRYLRDAVEGAEILREERVAALKKLARFSDAMFPSDSTANQQLLQ